MKFITATVRAEGKIVLCTATTGLAALNHEGGTTAHSMYKIPITDGEEAPQCNITGSSQRAELLKTAAVHIWDEFPMCHHKIFEAVNRCLCDLKQTTTPCGGRGRVFICCGDFRQIPPVIPGGGRRAIIEATIKLSPLWESFQQRELTPSEMRETAYSNFVDQIGDGRLPATHVTATATELVCLEPLAVTTDEDEAISFVSQDR